MRNSKLPCMVMLMQRSAFFIITSLAILGIDLCGAAGRAKYNTEAGLLDKENGTLENLYVTSQL